MMVSCIDNYGYEEVLTIGDIYDVELRGSWEGMYFVKDIGQFFSQDRFKPHYRKENLELLLS
jgi:hypothetical protein